MLKEHGEGLQVLYYKVGQKYDTHGDFFMDNFSVRHGGQRIATMLMYLSDVEEGGETVFPYANRILVLCHGGISFLIVEKKDFQLSQRWVMLYSMKPNATLDPSYVHVPGSCPVIKGDKWSCAKWMHLNEFNY
ncbi:probable prolyl 4-hydroxylase 3 [Cicer arietinum]|uniref:Probable prolyl 4-hydroxylase 3 n=1 Tax=Cicer arietinum TaxID=3827 RepID=A0A3Q7YEN5_CICAR|nr:probable prolyl 4-hydroxylase 3 [Cicer arietinum]